MATSHAPSVKKAATKKTTKKVASKKKPKKLPVCTTKDLKTKKSRRRKCRVVKAKPKPVVVSTGGRPSPTGPVAAPPAATPGPDSFPTAPGPGTPAPTDGLRSYAGTFGPVQAQRLLFRAGFGPTPGQAEAFAALGLQGAVDRLINPGPAQLVGPAPSGGYLVGGELAPDDRYGHLHLSMLDRQIRSTDSLSERMTLILHDWFGVATDNIGLRAMRGHIDLLRAQWRGSFRSLLLGVTQDPGMLMFLNGIDNQKNAPNENYGRELMELFSLGADRGAYTETDVREMARAFTGFRADYADSVGLYNFRFDGTRFDTGVKTIFAGTPSERTGRLNWQDGVNAVVDHPLHPSFVVLKLWSYFIPTAPTPQTQAELEALYRSSGEQLAPLVQAILLHPDLHQGAAMVKPPVVYVSGLLRGRGTGITTDAWTYLCDDAGQMLGYPPNVAGWNDRAWLNTSTHAARWALTQAALNPAIARAANYAGKTEPAADALDAALAFWGTPILADRQLAALRAVANQTWSPGVPGDQYGSMQNFLANRQNTLRQLVAAAPDFQVS